MKLNEVKKPKVDDDSPYGTLLQLFEAVSIEQAKRGHGPAKINTRKLSIQQLNDAVTTAVKMYNEKAGFLDAKDLGLLAKADWLKKNISPALAADSNFKPYADAINAIVAGGEAMENYARVASEIRWWFWSCAKDRQNGWLSEEAELALKALGVERRHEL